MMVLMSRKDRPDFFGDKRTRQAIALCLDRQKVVDTVLFGLSQVPDTYLPSDHPLHNANVQTYEYNPASGNKILNDVGWIDKDNNPSTPRVAQSVTNVPIDTPLILNYYTSSATQRHQVAEILTQSLGRMWNWLECDLFVGFRFLCTGTRQVHSLGVNSIWQNMPSA